MRLGRAGRGLPSRLRPAAAGGAAAVLALFALQSAAQARHWHDTVSLFRQALRAAPDDINARVNLGHALTKRGDLEEADANFLEALRLSPRLREVNLRLGANLVLTPGAEMRVLGVSLPLLPPRLSELQLAMDLGRLAEVPSEEDLLTAIVTAEEFLGAIPFAVRYDFFAGVRGATENTSWIAVHAWACSGRIAAGSARRGAAPARRRSTWAPGRARAWAAR